MDNRLDIQQITKKLENAFLPYRCVVHTENHENDLWIQVYNLKGKPIIHTPWVAIRKIEDESLLFAFIEQTIEALETKGYPITQ